MSLPALADGHRSTQRRLHLDIALRGLLAGILLTCLTSLGGRDPDPFLVATVLLVVVTFDARNPLCLRNMFLVYTVAIFGVGGPLLAESGSYVHPDAFWYVVVFLALYRLSSLKRRRGEEDDARPVQAPERSSPLANLSLVAVERGLIALVCLNLLLIALDLVRFGVLGFYRGQALAEQFSTYGRPSSGGGALQILIFLVRFSTLAGVVLYVHGSLASARRIRYRLVAALLVGVPVVALRRSDALAGALTLLAIYAVERRLRPRRTTSPATPPDPGDVATRAAVRRRGRALLVIGTMSLAMLASFVIGGIRARAISPTTTPPSAVPHLQSELTPIIAYSGIKANIGVLGHTSGGTIVPPLVLKLVPRAWLPSKPLNSGAYYMSKIRPAEYAAGFALPPTLFGDAYLNFGFLGALAACALLGAIAARLDLAYVEGRLGRLPWFLIAHANFYGLLRNALSESLAAVILTIVPYLVLRAALQTRPLATAPNGREVMHHHPPTRPPGAGQMRHAT